MLTDIIYDAIKPESFFAWACILGLLYWGISSLFSIGKDPGAETYSQQRMKEDQTYEDSLTPNEKHCNRIHNVWSPRKEQNTP